MWPFDSFRRKKILREGLLADAIWQETLANHPILTRLQPEELTRLRELTTLFMHEKRYEPVRGLVLDARMRAMVAVQACLPILHLGLDWYDDWQTLVMYPAQFVRPRAQFDDTGVMHQWQEVLGGESWERGPVILSWADVEASGLGQGYNVIVHEMAHKLDMRNGDADGFPPLHPGMRVRDWTDAFTSAYEDLIRISDAGQPPPIDAYGAESPAEFFAVASEYFFEQPGLLRTTYPAVYGQLAAFYRQHPAG